MTINPLTYDHIKEINDAFLKYTANRRLLKTKPSRVLNIVDSARVIAQSANELNEQTVDKTASEYVYQRTLIQHVLSVTYELIEQGYADINALKDHVDITYDLLCKAKELGELIITLEQRRDNAFTHRFELACTLEIPAESREQAELIRNQIIEATREHVAQYLKPYLSYVKGVIPRDE